MNEIEVKLIGIDAKNIILKLRSMGCNMVKQENQENYIYSLPEYMNSVKGYIRIRKIKSLMDNSEKNILCVKKIISQDSVKCCEEHETQVEDFDACSLFLSSIGIKFLVQRNKYRESYCFNDTLIELDIWDKDYFPEPYIEIEGESNEKIYETLDMLEIPHSFATSMGIEELKKSMGLI